MRNPFGIGFGNEALLDSKIRISRVSNECKVYGREAHRLLITPELRVAGDWDWRFSAAIVALLMLQQALMRVIILAGFFLRESRASARRGPRGYPCIAAAQSHRKSALAAQDRDGRGRGRHRRRLRFERERDP